MWIACQNVDVIAAFRGSKFTAAIIERDRVIGRWIEAAAKCVAQLAYLFVDRLQIAKRQFSEHDPNVGLPIGVADERRVHWGGVQGVMGLLYSMVLFAHLRALTSRNASPNLNNRTLCGRPDRYHRDDWQQVSHYPDRQLTLTVGSGVIDDPAVRRGLARG